MWQERDYTAIKRHVTSGWRRQISSNGQVGLLLCVRVWCGTAGAAQLPSRSNQATSG